MFQPDAADSSNTSTSIKLLDRIINEFPNEIIVNNARLTKNEITYPEDIKRLYLHEDYCGLDDQKLVKHFLKFKCDNPNNINVLLKDIDTEKVRIDFDKIKANDLEKCTDIFKKIKGGVGQSTEFNNLY